MSSPSVAPEPPKREFSWTGLFIKAAGFGAGFALMLGILAAVGIWYWTRPKPPRPWDEKTITAEYSYVDVEGEKNTIVVSYALQNNSNFDYTLEDSVLNVLGGKLQQENSVSPDKELLKLDYPLFVPAHNRTQCRVHVAYPYSEKEDLNAPTDVQHNYYTQLAKFMTDKMNNLDGFIFFDEAHRYKIVFPSGWKKRAAEPLRPVQK